MKSSGRKEIKKNFCFITKFFNADASTNLLCDENCAIYMISTGNCAFKSIALSLLGVGKVAIDNRSKEINKEITRKLAKKIAELKKT